MDGESSHSISPKMLIVLGVCALALGGYLASNFMGGPASPATLASRALSAGDLKERKQAAEELATMVDRVAVLPHLRRVATETKDPEIQAILFSRLLYLRDSESLLLCFTGLKNPSLEVRQKTYHAVQSYYGGTLPGGVEYAVDAPAETLAQNVAKLNELSDPNAASTSMSIASASATAKKDNTGPGTKKDDSVPNAVASAKKDEASSGKQDIPAKQDNSAAPASPAAPTGTLAPSPLWEPSPVLAAMVWMCRGLALLVLIAEVAGAFSIAQGEWAAVLPARKVDIKGRSPTDEVLEKLLVSMTPSLWPKITVLVGGIIVGAMLLITAEMIQMGVRMEQKMDYIAHIR